MKERIYLDTSVISYLRQEDAPLEMRITNEFWEILKCGDKYDVYISDVTIAEVSDCPEGKKAELFSLLEEIEYEEIKTEDNVHFTKILEDIQQYNILSPNSINDQRHIAAAIKSQCGFILSWNFKHFVDNDNTKRQVNAIAASYGMGVIQILAPSALMERRYIYE